MKARKSKGKTGKMDTKKKAVLLALEKSLGIVTTACKSVGISRASLYEWKEKDPEFKKAVDDIEDIAIDFVESRLFLKIRGDDITAIIFFLKCKGKKRGYVERVDITSGGKPLAPTQIIVNSKKTKDSMENMAGE